MFKHLFTPGQIGSVTIPNRLVVPAMVTNYCTSRGYATDRYIKYHEEKAQGGWGLIITEDYAVNPHAMGYECVPGLWCDEQIAGHRCLTEAVHKYGSKIFAQLYHAGRQTSQRINGGVQPVAPSPIPCPAMRELPRELALAEIKQLIEDFGTCALRIKQAGFDGLEIHAGHGYLIAQFLSPYANKRTDCYGGSFENRLRFLQEIVLEVRAQVGQEFPIIVRYSAEEGLPGGRTLAESRMIACELEQLGVDALHISYSTYGDYAHNIASPRYLDHAWLVPFAEEIKQLVGIPVITVNRINHPKMAENILAMGKADFIAMGRGSLADPYLPSKAKAGDLPGIRYCISCLQGCTGYLHQGQAITCLVNPALGRGHELDYTPATRPQKIFVAGGGPGGMEAARAAAIKGHHVELFESKMTLGGQFISAAYPPGKGELTTYLVWLQAELARLGVQVHLNTPLDASTVLAQKPDKVIVATGGKPFVPEIKGIDLPHVVCAEEVLLGTAAVGDRVVIAGGGEVGAETAAHLALQQKGVQIIELLPQLMPTIPNNRKYHLLKLLQEYKVQIRTQTKLCEITPEGAIIDSAGQTTLLAADTIVLALGYKSEPTLFAELSKVHDNVVLIGAAKAACDALMAAREGFDTGFGLS